VYVFSAAVLRLSILSCGLLNAASSHIEYCDLSHALVYITG
jgi:hypothetical protein